MALALRSVFGRRSFLQSVKPQIKPGFSGGGVTVRNHSDHGEAVEGCFSPQSREDPSVGEKFLQPHPDGICPRPAGEIYRNPFTFGRTRKSYRAGGIHRFHGSLSDPVVIKASLSAIKQYNKQQNKKLKFVGLLEAFVQVVCGRKFYLTVEALDAGVLNKYKVEITRNARKKCALELNSFKLVADSHET